MQFIPKYDIDYKPGDVAFTYYDASALSTGISWLETFGEITTFQEEFWNHLYSPHFNETGLKVPPSHVFMIVNEKTGIESAAKGAKYLDLQARFNDPHLRIVLRRPEGIDHMAVYQMLQKADALEVAGMPYDYTGLAGSVIRVFSPFNRIFPILNRFPNPLTLKGLYCSAFVAECLKYTDKYMGAKIFKEYHVSRIDPVTFWYCFPWMRLRLDGRHPHDIINSILNRFPNP